jgi:hypothetical protein
MSRSTSSRKVFTVQQANAALPLVRAIVTDLVHLSREVNERRQRLAVLFSGRRRDRSDPYREELSQIEEELDKDTQRLREFVEELKHLGVEPKSATEGLVDFPSVVEGRRVYLCWKLGEPEVLYWHDLDAGFQGRQPLTAGSVADSPDAASENL